MSESEPKLDFESAPIREEYSEYDTESGRVGVILDPENQLAWIRSDVTCDVDP